MKNPLLRLERLRKGWSQQQLADFALVSLSTVARAERGEAIRIDSIQRLCECLSKTSEELGLLKLDMRVLESNSSMERQSPFYKNEERDGCFSFGKLKTTWKTLDGDGKSIYLPQHICSHHSPLAQELPAELQAIAFSLSGGYTLSWGTKRKPRPPRSELAISADANTDAGATQRGDHHGRKEYFNACRRLC